MVEGLLVDIRLTFTAAEPTVTDAVEHIDAVASKGIGRRCEPGRSVSRRMTEDARKHCKDGDAGRILQRNVLGLLKES